MKQKLVLSTCMLFFSLSMFSQGETPFSAQNSVWQNPATDWFSQAKIGAFAHFLPDETCFNQLDKYDVEGVAEQLSKAKVGYFVFTLGQNSGFFNAPNPVYDKLTGYRAGERCSTRDIPLELAKALKKKGIRFMLYLPCQTPFHDLKAVTALGFPKEPVNDNRNMTALGTDNWARVIKYWSKHYGKLVSGWWFDGGYKHNLFDNLIAQKYAKAAKAGNKNSIVTFNPGISLKRATAFEDYTAGEIRKPLEVKASERWVDGSQLHVLTFMGDSWGQHNLRYDDKTWIDWIKDFTSHGGVVSIDMGVNFDAQKGALGSFDDKQIEQMRHITDAVLNCK
jgi:hypothetical protein